MYSVNEDHGTDESTIDEPFHAEEVQLIEPRGFLVTGWTEIETLRIEKTNVRGYATVTLTSVILNHDLILIRRPYPNT
ncbi:MAG: hypothetical protein EZS28_013855 [Streblomastix strix]|uniref:Uncharacterized protein n=1 Tax=Streblomastix strix TaxID=222440 RepID=A0A5J4W8A8_9EUKA|nr:MAG: hypothetical protein EZS28_013855 [Streblomastix strix]